MAIKPTKINVQLGYMGKGYLDPKAGVRVYSELAELVDLFKEFMDPGHVVYVMQDEGVYASGWYQWTGTTFSFVDLSGKDGETGDRGPIGKPGLSKWTMFAYYTKDDEAIAVPDDDEIEHVDDAPPESFIYNGIKWADGPPTDQIATGRRLYMLNTKSYDPGQFEHVQWQRPAVYIDGDEGRDAGIWSIWNDKKDGKPTNPPHDESKMDNETDMRDMLIADGNGWYDDVDDKNMDGVATDPGEPVWMATSTLDVNGNWKPWAVVKVTGEKPAYMVNMFKWATSTPSAPSVTEVAYGVLGSDIEGMIPTEGWKDAPSSSPGVEYTLYSTLTKIIYTGATKETIIWSPVIQVEGDEGPKGEGTSIWVVWSPSYNPSALKQLTGAWDAFTDDASLMTFLGNPTDWRADAGVGDEIYMATANHISGDTWTNWNLVKVKGEDGKAFKVDLSGSDSPWVMASKPLPPGIVLVEGFAYVDIDGPTGIEGGQLYFLNDLSKATIADGWSDPMPFGAGKPGATTYFYFTRSDSKPSAPAAGGPAPSPWSDSTPPGDKIIWMTNVVKNSDGVFGTYSDPVQVEGADGIPGVDGSSLWTIFTATEELTQDINTIATPDGIPGTWSLPDPNPDNWVDDVGTNNENLGGHAPKWMAMSKYDPINKQWSSWILSMIKGEKPSYSVNAFCKHSATAVPGPPTQVIDYGDGWDPSTTTDDYIAGWRDYPESFSDATKSVWMSTRQVSAKDNDTNSWSTPISMDANEGYSAGMWTIWWEQDTLNDITPTPPGDPNSMITGGATEDTISGMKDPGDPTGWVDDISTSSTGKYYPYMAITNRIGTTWTDWDIVKVKGEKGDTGQRGETGKPGGTIIMLSPANKLGGFPTPAHPEDFGKGEDPEITADDVEAAGDAGSSWVANITTADDAVYLAIMTFGYDSVSDKSAWSVWRVSRIKGISAPNPPVPEFKAIGATSMAQMNLALEDCAEGAIDVEVWVDGKIVKVLPLPVSNKAAYSDLSSTPKMFSARTIGDDGALSGFSPAVPLTRGETPPPGKSVVLYIQGYGTKDAAMAGSGTAVSLYVRNTTSTYVPAPGEKLYKNDTLTQEWEGPVSNALLYYGSPLPGGAPIWVKFVQSGNPTVESSGRG